MNDIGFILTIGLWSIVLFLFTKYEIIGVCQWDKWFHPARLRDDCPNG